MATRLRLDDIRRARDANDPELVPMVAALAEQAEEPEAPVREGAPTFDRFLAEIRNPAFRRKPVEEFIHWNTWG